MCLYYTEIFMCFTGPKNDDITSENVELKHRVNDIESLKLIITESMYFVSVKFFTPSFPFVFIFFILIFFFFYFLSWRTFS